MDLDNLRRDSSHTKSGSQAIAQINVKRVTVSKNDIIHMPDGTTVVRDRNNTPQKERKLPWD